MALARPGAHASSRNRPEGYRSDSPTPCVAPGLQLFSDMLHMPFDVMRTQHAEAIHAGLMANSILESRDFENSVDALEHIWLGPFARDV
jgi:hypothetical protein